MKTEPIETVIGKLKGRNALYLTKSSKRSCRLRLFLGATFQRLNAAITKGRSAFRHMK
jgi:hypothetical protein